WFRCSTLSVPNCHATSWKHEDWDSAWLHKLNGSRVAEVGFEPRSGTSIRDNIQHHRLRWLGHVLRMPKHRLPRRVLFSVPPSGWRKPRGGQHMTWQKGVKEIMKSLGVVGVVRLPGWGPRDSVCAWLETLQEMAADRSACSYRLKSEVSMGNGSSAISGEPLDPKLLQGSLLVDQTFMYDVTSHHTIQRAYSHQQIIKFSQVDRQNEGRLRLNHRANLQFCLERHFQLTDLLSNASIPTKCRHPCILRVQRSLSDPINNNLFLLTEPCLPLNFLIASCTDADLLLGARSILNALNFIHTNLSISHNNVRATSIFVSSDTSWKLSGFEFALPFSKMDTTVVELLERLVSDSAEPEETALAFHPAYPFCYDIFAFSRLFSNLVNKYGKDSELFSDFLQVLHKSCMHSQPRARLPPAQLMVHPVFRHPLASSVNFFENYMAYSDEEKVKFFHSFKEKIATQLPIEVVCQKLVPFCLHSTVFLDPPSQFLIVQLLYPYNDSQRPTANVTPGNENISWLSYTAFKRYVSPLILGKFRIRERQTRITLLERFTGYVHLFETSELRDTVLPEVCLGLFDQHSLLSQLSIRALGELSRLLGAVETLNVLRQTEIRLTHQGIFTTAIKHSTNSQWPRTHLFSEAAPKIGRQQRELPASEKRRTDGGTLSLAQMAALSGSYEPNSNPILQQAALEIQASGQPQKLSGNAIKLSGAPTVHEPHSTERNDLHYSDQTVVNVNIDVLNTSEETSTAPFTVSQPYLDGHLIENGPIPKSPLTEPVMASIHPGEQPAETAQPSQKSVTSVSQALSNAISSLSVADTRNGQEDDETAGNDWDNDWDFDP
ncbi:hypothetical protein T265_12964, partial [Opisthorchis viverrini]